MSECVGAYCPPPPPLGPAPPPDYSWVMTLGITVIAVVVLTFVIYMILQLRRIRKAKRQALIDRAERQTTDIANGNVNAIFGDYPVNPNWELGNK